jgi:hypothetical protein
MEVDFFRGKMERNVEEHGGNPEKVLMQIC